MTETQKLVEKEAIIAAVLAYYRQESAQLSGPTEATAKLWPTLRRRIPSALMQRLAQEAIAHEVGRRATNGMGLGRGWQAAEGMVSITYNVPTDPAQRGEPVQVKVQQLPYSGPQVVYPRILVETLYTTATVVKPLIQFTREDFDYCIAGFEDQRDGIERHIDVMQYGFSLLGTHHVARVAELPHDVIVDFAQRWQATVRAPKEKAETAA